MKLGSQGRTVITAMGEVGWVGGETAVSIMVGYLGGQWLDGRLGTTPWLKWIGFVFGVVAGYRSLYRFAVQKPKGTKTTTGTEGPQATRAPTDTKTATKTTETHEDDDLRAP